MGLLKTGLAPALVLASSTCGPEADLDSAADSALDGIPVFEPATDWPGSLPAHWIVGPGTGIYVDDEDAVWALHRPERISPEDFAAAEGHSHVAEADPGRRWQKLLFTGTRPAGP